MRKGFTLTELLVVLAIAGIILVLGLTWLNAQYESTRFSTSLNTLKTGLYLARVRAMSNRGGTGSIMFLTDLQAASQNLTFTLGVDPYTGDAISVDFKTGQPYYIQLINVSPRSGPGNNFPWYVNDRICEITTVPTTSTPTMVCRCPDSSGGYLNLTSGTNALNPNPMQLATCSTAILTALLRMVPVTTGTVIDSATDLKMSKGSFHIIRDLGSIIEFNYNPEHLDVKFFVDGVEETNTANHFVLFDTKGLTKDARSYQIQLGFLKNGTIRSTATQTITPAGLK